MSDKHRYQNVKFNTSKLGRLGDESITHLPLVFDSGHDLRVRETEPRIRAVSMEPAWNSLSPSLSALSSLSCMCSLS